MKLDFRKRLEGDVILADGAMGTELYRRGIFINQCYDHLNITKQDLVKKIHREYVEAGAEIIETNTFGANRIKLLPFGLEEEVRSINIAGARIAREIAGDRVYVAGSMGPLGKEIEPLGLLSEKEAFEAFLEQAKALVDGGVDLIILETFTSLKELEIACKAVRSFSDIPLIVQISFRYYGEGKFSGITPEEFATEASKWNVDVIGTNCGNGPRGVYECIERLIPFVKNKPVSSMPNAGLPEIVKGRTIYLTTPEYFAEYGRRMIQKGVKIVGGCCGTTPEHIKELRKFIKSIQPRIWQIEVQEIPERKEIPPKPIENRSRFGELLKKKDHFIICVEVDPPFGISHEKELKAVAELLKGKIDAVNIADGPRAMARMSPIALGKLITEKSDVEVIIHYTCRDRNLLGIQMDLIGANALGLRNILAITGDPPKMGDYPDATAVFDIDSIGLIHLIQNLNRGLDFTGKFIGEATSFVVGAGCNPGAVNFDYEIERFKKKIQAGAEFIFTQPVYEPSLLEKFLDATKEFSHIPIIVGILPLASYRNAEFLHNEVPGMQIPPQIMERMAKAPSKEAQREEGIKIAKEMLSYLRKVERVKGVYIFPPFGRYESVLRVLE
jgi:homocysteine S-methyltransferase